jgi:CRISPR-associated protein Csx10
MADLAGGEKMSIQWLAIKPEEPLLIGNVKSNTNFLSTLDYIPGRVLRGAWASWLLNNGFAETVVDKVKGLQIGNFFPAAEWRKIKYVSPFLLSMLTCKQNSGFQTEPYRDNRGHGIVDSLLIQLSYYLLEERKARMCVPFSILCQDEECKSRMEHAGGFFSVQWDEAITNYIRFRPKYHTQTRGAISRYRNASYEGMLYTTTALSPNVDMPDDIRRPADLIFIGRVRGSEDNIENLVGALNETPIGSKCSIGYGRISCKKEQISLESLENRLGAFNNLLIKIWGDLKRLALNESVLPERPEKDSIYFSLDLMAPAILKDSDGLPSLIPSLQIGGKTIEPIFWLTRPDFAGGWSETWGLQKQTALAARIGSSYVFKWDGPIETLVNALKHIEDAGVGERRDEGFGECWICHPFHQEVNEK